MRAPALAIVSAIVLAACGQAGPSASSAASPRPSPSGSTGQASPSPNTGPAPTELGGSFGVLASRPLPGEVIQLSIVAGDGWIAASTTAQPRTSFNCIGAGPILPLATVSASSSRLYYLDGDTTVRFLAPDGTRGNVGRVPGGGQLASTFAVTPDGRRIAVVSTDYSQPTLPVKIYVEDVSGGGNHVEIYSGNGDHGVPWAMGWRSGQLVLGYTAGCTQGGGPFAAFPYEFHVVDGSSAVRRATLGSGAGCHTVSLPTPGGVACLAQSGEVQVLGWDGRPLRSFPASENQYFDYALSPSGVAVAACCEPAGATTVLLAGNPALHAAGVSGAASGWIDDSLLLIGSPDKQSQARIFKTASGGGTIPVAAVGYFVARLPGGLDVGHGT